MNVTQVSSKILHLRYVIYFHEVIHAQLLYFSGNVLRTEEADNCIEGHEF